MSERHLLTSCMGSEAVSGRFADSTELGAGIGLVSILAPGSHSEPGGGTT